MINKLLKGMLRQFRLCNASLTLQFIDAQIFNYDSEVDVPADTARRDYMEFVVEKISRHLVIQNGSTMIILIIHGSCGNHYGSVKHSMII